MGEGTEQTKSEETPLEIPAAARFWDELLQGREELRQFREEFEEHRNRVRERHTNMGKQLAVVVTVAEANTAARESFEDEIIQLHIVMKQWYHSIIDLHKDVMAIASALGVGGLASLGPPMRPPLREREHGRA
jgi:hypothetical protein